MRAVAVVALLAALIWLTGLYPSAAASGTLPEASGTAPAFSLSSDLFAAELAAFMGERRDGRFDRTSFTEREVQAAAYIEARLAAFGVNPERMQANLLHPDGVLPTQNILAVYNPGKAKRVIIGAHYDNGFGAVPAVRAAATGSQGVLDNATGVAALLLLAREYFTVCPDLEFTVEFVFFGGGAYTLAGSLCYVRDRLSGRLDDTALMVSLRSLAGNRLYVYDDEVSTLHGGRFFSLTEGLATAFSGIPAAAPLYPVSTRSHIPYSHFGMEGAHLPFLAGGVNTLHVFGGEPFMFSYAHTTGADSLPSFILKNPGYADVMRDAAAAVWQMCTQPDLLGLSAQSAAARIRYNPLMERGVASAAAIGAILLFAGALAFIVHRLNKIPPPENGVRSDIRVFGDDYGI